MPDVDAGNTVVKRDDPRHRAPDDGPLPSEHDEHDVLKSYRYLRVGMIGTVILLFAAVLREYADADCWQTSISAYYYTPAGEVFVGSMLAVGFALLVIKGRGAFEDFGLNFAGMMAPIVAFAPTTDFQDRADACWSEEPKTFPRTPVNPDGSGGQLEAWVTAQVDNNISALLWAGGIGLLLALAIAGITYWAGKRRNETSGFGKGAVVTWVLTAAVVLAVALAYNHWDDFYSQAHGIAAVAMFVGLNLVAWRRSLHHLDRGDRTCPEMTRRFGRRTSPVDVLLWLPSSAMLKWVASGTAAWFRGFAKGNGYFLAYAPIALAMTVGGLTIRVGNLGGEYETLILETYEIVLFALFWAVQTAENWFDDPVVRAAKRGGNDSLRNVAREVLA